MAITASRSACWVKRDISKGEPSRWLLGLPPQKPKQ